MYTYFHVFIFVLEKPEYTVKSSVFLVFKVRKRSAQLTSVEGHLDSKVAEVTDHMARVAELEEDLAKKASQMQRMKAELDERNQTRAQSEALAEKMRALHGEQCQEMEAQIDMVSRLPYYEVKKKMATIFQTTFWNAFSWLKMYQFQLRFHWILFPRAQLTVSQHWFR